MQTIILNSALNHRIEVSTDGFALFGSFGYQGTYASEMEARSAYRAPQTNYDHASTPDGI